MSKILIVGDSQAQGTPGLYAQRKFEAAGHTVRRIAQQSCGAIDWSSNEVSPDGRGCRMPGLWDRYTSTVASFQPDLIVLIFGSNDMGSRLDDALLKLKSRVRPPVWMSGPPLYPLEPRQRDGLAIKATNQQVFGPRFIDAYPFTPLSIPRDHLNAHLPGEGGRPWGEAIAEAVMRGMANTERVVVPTEGLSEPPRAHFAGVPASGRGVVQPAGSGVPGYRGGGRRSSGCRRGGCGPWWRT
jgi:hypothetical protein